MDTTEESIRSGQAGEVTDTTRPQPCSRPKPSATQHNPDGSAEWDGLPMPRRVWAILAVAFGVSLSVLDGTIANVALPTIAAQLDISSANSIWIVNAYQLAIMVTLLSFSALGDVIGYRKVYLGGLALFTVASVGCALSTSLLSLIHI